MRPWSCIALQLALTGCTANIPSYEHPPTSAPFSAETLSSTELADFRVGGVLVRPSMVQGYPEVRLTFYCVEACTVRLDRVRLAGKGKLAEQELRVDVGETIEAASRSDVHGLFVGGHTVKLGIAGETFDGLGTEGFVLDVELSELGGSAPAAGKVSFDVVTTVHRRILWPT